MTEIERRAFLSSLATLFIFGDDDGDEDDDWWSLSWLFGNGEETYDRLRVRDEFEPPIVNSVEDAPDIAPSLVVVQGSDDTPGLYLRSTLDGGYHRVGRDVVVNHDHSRTHFVGTGDDPQAVIDGASAGDSIVFIEGTHTHDPTAGKNNAICYVNKSLEVVVPKGATLKFADNSLGGTGTTGFHFRIGDGATSISDVTIRGKGTLDGNDANNNYPPQSDTHLPSGVYIHGDVTDVSVDDLHFQDIDSRTVFAAAPTGVTASNITVRNTTAEGCMAAILLGHPDFDGDVRSCVVEGNRIEPDKGHAQIEPNHNCYDVEVRDNVLVGAETGIFCWRGPQDVLIEDNVIRDGVVYEDTAPQAIGVNSPSGYPNAEGIVIRNNWIRDHPRAGMKLQKVTGELIVKDNTVEDIGGQKEGLRIESTVDTALVRGNTVHDTEGSGLVTVSPTAIVSDNLVYDTHLNTSNATPMALQVVNATTRCNVTGNHVYQAAAATVDYGLRLDNVSTGYGSENVVLAADFATGAINDGSNASFTVTNNHI